MTKVTMYSWFGITWWIEHSQGPGSAKCHDQQKQAAGVRSNDQRSDQSEEILLPDSSQEILLPMMLPDSSPSFSVSRMVHNRSRVSNKHKPIKHEDEQISDDTFHTMNKYYLMFRNSLMLCC